MQGKSEHPLLLFRGSARVARYFFRGWQISVISVLAAHCKGFSLYLVACPLSCGLLEGVKLYGLQ